MKKIVFGFIFIVNSVQANSTLATKALSLLESLESSDYGTRMLCVQGNDVVGIIPGRHWSLPISIAKGTLQKFPQTIVESPRGNDFPIKLARPSQVMKSVDGTDFIQSRGTVYGKQADICVSESKMVLE